MERILLSELIRGIATPAADCYIDNVTYDSRTAGPGSLFLAIKGERVNGEAFAKSALENGARFVLSESFIPDIPKDKQAQVENILDASIQLGANVRVKFDIDIIAVTGSVGKTTTKDFIYTAISPFAKTVRSEGNHNNELGMPRTIYTFTHDDKYAVLEMGMEHPGDIHKLTVAAKPKAACITGIGISHLERLGSRENIFKAKMEIVDGMGEDGILVLNADDDFLPQAEAENIKKIYYYGVDNPADVMATDISIKGRDTYFTILDKEYGEIPRYIPAVGLHNVRNALCAYTLVTRLGYDPHQTAKNLSGYVPSGMRQNFVERGGILFIEDCYNAAPDSMKAALDTLATVAKGRKIAVLGDMKELGEDTLRLHRQTGRYAAEKGVDIMLTCGPLAVEIATGYGEGRLHFDNKERLAGYLAGIMERGDTIIFKASHSMRFEDIIKQVYETQEK